MTVTGITFSSDNRRLPAPTQACQTESKSGFLWPRECSESSSPGVERIHRLLQYPIVIDGRNLYDLETMAARGFSYYSVGRPLIAPVQAAA